MNTQVSGSRPLDHYPFELDRLLHQQNGSKKPSLPTFSPPYTQAVGSERQRDCPAAITFDIAPFHELDPQAASKPMLYLHPEAVGSAPEQYKKE